MTALRTVLIIDDDKGMQQALESLLLLEGYRAIIARDGIEALHRLSETPPALILLDLVMPRMDGYAFAAELERRGLRQAIPIIVLTADGRARQKAEALGADDFVEKPFDIDVLMEKITRLVG